MNRGQWQTTLAAVLLFAAPVILTGCPKPVPAISVDVSDPSSTPTSPASRTVFTYYLRQVQAKISGRWTPPGAARAWDRTVVMFEIGRDGSPVKEPVVEQSSGNAVYDEAALRAVVEASPFPPLPLEFKPPSLKVHFGFEFRGF